MTPRAVTIAHGGAQLRAEIAGAGAPLIFLHAGVADRRMWRTSLDHFAATHTALTYDRRGFGETATPDEAFSSVGDLRAIIDTHAGDAPVLIGCSQGGRVAIDFALAYPEMTAALILVGTSCSGAPLTPPFPWPIAVEMARLERAEDAGDVDLVNTIEARLWLDGPLAPEGRVSGAARQLFLDMNAVALQHAPLSLEEPPPNAFERLGAITAPTLVICGDLDFPHIQERSDRIAHAMPNARALTMKNCAHLPNLEQPAAFNDAVAAFIASL